jgi:tetratricopeptide (TPR) repeat protein
MGELAGARSQLERALVVRTQVLGERHPDTTASLNNLARLLVTQKDYAAARPLYERALAIAKAAHGERHPEVATELSKLADLLKSQGDYAAARSYLEQALSIRTETLGERHPDTASSLNNLALVLKRQEMLKERDRLWKEAQQLRAEGKIAEALAAGEAMLAIERRELPADDPDLVGFLSWLAALHVAREDFAAAAAARRETLEILLKHLGASDWRVVDARLAIVDVESQAKLAPDQRRRLAETMRLDRMVVELYHAGKFAEATASA